MGLVSTGSPDLSLNQYSPVISASGDTELSSVFSIIFWIKKKELKRIKETESKRIKETELKRIKETELKRIKET